LTWTAPERIVLMVLDVPNGDRIAVRRAATRLEILDAAWVVARTKGLVELTLRDVADRVGMRAPSLYGHFASKHAIYDAMFEQAWSDYEATIPALEDALPSHPRTAVRAIGAHFYDFTAADLARHQLMNQSVIAGFSPSAEAYAPSVRVLRRAHDTIVALTGATSEDFEVWVALLGGLINQHHANDAGGSRHRVLLDRGVDMWADAVGLPPDDQQ
jgi:AcrR family transcriptional regulator